MSILGWHYSHEYEAGYWGLAVGVERGLETTEYTGDQSHVHIGRRVWVFRNRPAGEATDE